MSYYCIKMGIKNSKYGGGFGALDPKRNGFNKILDPKQNGSTDAFNRSLADTRRKFDPATNGLSGRWDASINKTCRDLNPATNGLTDRWNASIYAFRDQVGGGLIYAFQDQVGGFWRGQVGKTTLNIIGAPIGLPLGDIALGGVGGGEISGGSVDGPSESQQITKDQENMILGVLAIGGGVVVYHLFIKKTTILRIKCSDSRQQTKKPSIEQFELMTNTL